MDMIKIGQFLAQLRRENNLTQEELGEQLGVTNKTVSRWETGTYLPPVEMLQLLSEKYGITINEILAGERLTDDGFKQKADENLTTALESSVFSLKDKINYLRKKWLKDHAVEVTLEIIVIFAAVILGAIFYRPVMVATSIITIAWAWMISDRRQSYINRHLYEDVTKNKDQ